MNSTKTMGLVLLTAAKGTCPECGVLHLDVEPHDQQSMHYQIDFFSKHGRWPTWNDALAHCDEETKRAWSIELALNDISVNRPGAAALN